MAAMMVVAFVPSNAKNGSRGHYPSLQMFSELPGPDDDTSKNEGNAKFPLPKQNVNPSDNTDNSPLYGSDPSNVSTSVEYDPETNSYNFQKTVDGMPIGTPYSMPFDDYVNYNFEKAMNSYWHQRAKKNREQNQEINTNLIPHLEVGGEIFDRIFGGNVIDIKPQGSAELTLGLEYTRTDNPALDSKQQRQVNLDFDEKIQMNVVGQIGTKMKVNISYDTEASFDFENNVKLEYTGDDDDIIQKIEAGNVSLPLTGTLIQGSQSLFGVKTELKFGKLTLTGLLSQKKSETSTINVEGGSTTKEFEIKADNYEENKHFFLSHYFKENYDRSMASLPVIMGGVTINRVEVWVTNKTGNYTDARNIIALVDLGESNSNDIQSMYVSSSLHNNTTLPPYNDINILGNLAQDYPEIRDINTVSSTLQNLQMAGGTDFEKIESARKLNPSEYTLNAQLGYISLNSKLNADQVLAVAYEYTVNGEVYTVGEFSNSAIAAPQTLIVKLIKGTSFTPSKKNWDLMMKNVYNIGAYQITREDFTVDILYTNDKTGTDLTYIPAGEIDSIQLLRVMGLDNLNTNNDPYPDGMFDYVENYTISSSGGRIIFPVREPFGSYLYDKITGGNSALNNVADAYVFPELYDSTKSKAQQLAEKNKFKLKGRYKSTSSSEISLNAINVPQGSVSVTAGSTLLVENVDYTVDYNLGRVKILNQGILEAGTPISINLESNSVGTMQTKTLTGLHANYDFSNNFNIGATILHLKEKPMTQKVNIGEEPLSNTIWGANLSYRTDVPFLTKAIDFLPLIQTKEMSTVTFNAEFAQLLPGHSRAIGKEGAAYIDDFESSKITNDVKSYVSWSMSSTPNDSILFPESSKINDLEYGKNRARLSWFVVDQTLHESSSPISIEDRSSHYTRLVYEKELFPNRESESANLEKNLAPLNVVFYPNEKGPYNFDVAGMNSSGRLENPRKRWAGIQRQLTTTDFEDANIEYIEFWMMDPFVEDSTNPGGDLYFNLGDISEDILKDGRKSFEQGLPAPSLENPVDTTAWGIVPNSQALVSAFDNSAEIRFAQDVGFDGLSTENETTFFSDYLEQVKNMFGENSEAYQMALADPSSDNFHHYKGSDYDQQGLNILQRYKYFNGLEGNSIPREYQTETYITNSTTTPDVEDINRDNTLSESENFFQYRVSIRPQDLIVGQNYIADKTTVNVTLANDENSQVSWYQFKIPISEYSRKVGSISDFKSIRFMRMFMTNFDTTTCLRFGTLDLVRGEWRKYDDSFLQPGEYVVNELENTSFDVSAVNIEENASRRPVNYVLPPGVTREQNTMNPQLQQLNEQAMTIKVLDLADGDARAVYKNVYLDVRKYLRMQMFVHAESVVGKDEIKDGDMSVFVRLGTDYKNNYYEFEVPLKVTPEGYYSGDDLESPDRYLVWPEENDINIVFEDLTKVKENRNELIRLGNQNVGLTKLYYEMNDRGRISVMGNPTLSNVQTIMIGVRNPKQVTLNGSDDGLPKSAEIWVNELRLTNFNEKSGWAATARATAKLADFGTVTLSGTTKKPGFGALNSTIKDRLTEEINQYDFSSSFEFGKFFPERFNVRIPLYVAVSENVSNPEYDPLSPDVLMKNTLKNPDISKEYKDSIKHLSQDYVKRTSINLTNVKVNGKQGQKPHVYNLSNFSLSYGYNNVFQRDPNTVFRTTITHTASIFYNYNATPKVVEPLKNVKLFKKKAFQILRDFNFYYLPSQLSFRSNLNRQYGETQIRNVYDPSYSLPISVIKDFTIIRQYDFKYNFSKNLKFEYTATNNARIDEPEGRLYKGDPEYEQKMDSIWKNFKTFGRNTSFYQQWSASYTLPINKIPIFNWISASVRYQGSYNWTAGAITADTLNIGNVVQNANTMSASTQFNLLNLYNKVKYLKDVNNKYRGRTSNKKKESETVTYDEDINKLAAGKKKTINHKLKTKNVTIKVTDDKGRPINADMQVIDDNKLSFTVEKDVENVKVRVTGKRDKKESIAKIIADNILVLLMSVKNVSANVSETNGTLLPGYMGKTKLLGMSKYTPDAEMFGEQPSLIAPTFPFVIGWQVKDFGEWACEHNLVTKDTSSIQAYTQTHSRNWNFRASLEPVRDLKIDLSMLHNYSENKTKYYRYGIDPVTGEGTFRALNPSMTGSFSMSTITIKSAFEKFKSENYVSETFTRFSENRLIIAQRLAKERPDYDGTVDEDGFPSGFGRTAQDVLIPAFFAAYTGQDPNKVNLSTIPGLWSALPNWQVVYDGLSKIPKLKKVFRSLSLKHSYRSTYNIGSFQTRLINEYDPDDNGLNHIRDELNNIYSRYVINGISISEQLSPLISFDMMLVNSMTVKVEVKKTRNLTMSFSNNQLTEVKNNELIIGAGYRFKDVALTIKIGSRKRDLKSDLNLRFDFSARKQITMIRKLEEAQDQPTSGNIQYTFKLSADYVLSNRFNISLFYDQSINNPIVGTSFKTVTAKVGLMLRFTLAT